MAIVRPGENGVEEIRSQQITGKRLETSRRKVPTYVYYALLLLVVVFFALIRFRLREMPLERDEGEYAYAGQLILQGINPYQFAYTVKLPGTSAAYAVVLAVLGQTPAGIHLGLMVVNAATTFLVFLLGTWLYGRLAGFVAGASYALLTATPTILGFAGHATHFVVLFAIAGVLLLLKALEAGRLWLFFASGLLFGLAFLMKQPGLFFLLFAAVYVIQQGWKPGANRKAVATRMGALVVGGVVPYAITILLMLRDGLLQKFWFWTVAYAGQYGTQQRLSESILHLLGQTFFGVTTRVTALLLFTALVLMTLRWSARARSHGFFTISFFVFSGLAVCPGFYFRSHYFILVLPAVSVLLGMMVSCITEQLLVSRRSLVLAGVPMLVFLIGFSAAIFLQREFLFQMTPLQACRNLYGANPFAEAIELGQYIQDHTSGGATVAVLGSEPEIYFYSHRRSATGYIYTYPLLEPQKHAIAMQSEMIHEIETARPEVLLFVNVNGSWVHSLKPGSSRDIMDWIQRYIQEHYVMDGVADIGDPTQYHWGEHAKDYLPRSKNYVWVFKRKPS